MSVNVTRLQPPATIAIELDERTAEQLCAIVGGARGTLPEGLRDLFDELDHALPNRSTSFVDLFEITNGGVLRCK